MLKRFISSLRVKCKNAHRGCKWQGEVGNMEVCKVLVDQGQPPIEEGTLAAIFIFCILVGMTELFRDVFLSKQYIMYNRIISIGGRALKRRACFVKESFNNRLF